MGGLMPRVAVLNLTRQLGHDADLLGFACKGADVLLGCEGIERDGSPLLVAPLLPAGWQVWQNPATSSSAGSFVAWRTATMQAIPGTRGLVVASPADDQVRPRQIAHIDLRERSTGHTDTYAAWHAPLMNTDVDDDFYRTLRAFARANPRAVLGGDCNRRPAAVAAELGREHTGVDVMGLFWPADLDLMVVHRLAHPGSDHRIIRATLTSKETPVSNAQLFPGADHTTQWFADNFPGTRFVANCGVIHSTEGTDWPGYSGGATAPTITIKPDIPNKRFRRRQHFPIDMSSRALRNLSGGVNTNTAGAVQLELIGTTDPKHRRSWNGAGNLLAGRDYIFWPEAPDWALVALGKDLAWFHLEHGIKLQAPSLWLPYPESFGATRARMTFEQWRNFLGWCAHQHVPENSHGDVKLDIVRVLEVARNTVAPTPPPAPPADTVTRVERVRADLLEVLNSDTAKGIPTTRTVVHRTLDQIRNLTLTLED